MQTEQILKLGLISILVLATSLLRPPKEENRPKYDHSDFNGQANLKAVLFSYGNL